MCRDEINNEEFFVPSLEVVARKYHFTNCNYFRYKRRLSLPEYPNRRLSVGMRTLFSYLCCSSAQLLIVAWKLHDLFHVTCSAFPS